MKEFYIKNKKILNIILVIAISFGFLSLAKTCYAWEVIDAAITSLLGWIAILITKVCGWILLTVIAAVVDIAQYNDFINNPQIKDAWVIIRDMCNMFFILILLIIAFATILRIENYNVKKLLPKLLIMAILINFSRTICGLFIDFSQVIMLTFVNAFADAKGNFVTLLKVEDYLSLAKNQGSWAVDDSINLQSTVAGIVVAVLFMIIATITMIAILIIFVMRVIMLWIYVILSPLAFLLSAFPAGQKYAGQYWGDFTKYLINGPVLAFFIWLALVTMGSLNVNDFAKTFAGGKVEMLQPTNFMHFIIAIGMLVGGLMVSQQIGGIGASWGASAVGSIKTKGWGIAKGATKWGVKKGVTWTGRQLDTVQMAAQEKIASKLGAEDYKAKSLNYRMIKAGWDRNRADKMAKYESGLSGAWQDRFHRASTAQGGLLSKVPLIATARRIKARKEIDKLNSDMNAKEADVKNLEKEKEGGVNEMREMEINNQISQLKSGMAKDRRFIIQEREKLPEDRQANIEQQRTISKYHSEIKEENHDEDGLVAAFLREKNMEKKRAYFQHLVAINGTNTLFETKGQDMNFEGIKNFLETTFGDNAGDVAADMAKRAEAVGNSKLIGFAAMDIAKGKNVVTRNEKIQIEVALRKNREKYDQAFARQEHFDSLVDQDDKGARRLSRLGALQLLNIGQSSGRMSEITKGNFQDRYGKTVVSMLEDSQLTKDKLKKLFEGTEISLSEDNLKAIQYAAERFMEYYDPNAVAKRKERGKIKTETESKTSDEDGENE